MRGFSAQLILACVAVSAEPIKVFVVSGQSNMEGYGLARERLATTVTTAAATTWSRAMSKSEQAPTALVLCRARTR